MMNEMHHPTADRLEAFVEGVLEAGDRVIIESHILACADCQSAVEEWRALFAALDGLPHFEPATGFADRVIARLDLDPATGRARSTVKAGPAGWSWQGVQAAVAAHAGRAGAAVAGLMPKTTFGWAMATAFISLPFVIGAAIIGWLISRSYITPGSLWLYASTQAADGLRALGEAAVAMALQTYTAGWLVGQGASLLETVGATGVGAVLVAAGVATVLSVWVLYRNLFRTPTRETNYVLHSF
jgi:hypothetical protein